MDNYRKVLGSSCLENTLDAATLGGVSHVHGGRGEMKLEPDEHATPRPMAYLADRRHL
jgi:hypothetical protein